MVVCLGLMFWCFRTGLLGVVWRLVGYFWMVCVVSCCGCLLVGCLDLLLWWVCVNSVGVVR